MKIGKREIGSPHPCLIIAEAGVNHNGSPELAKRLVDAAVASGADAIKFQTFTAEKLASAEAPRAAYQLRTGPHETQLEMLRRLELSVDAFRELHAYCQRQGLLFLSTPFDHESANVLAELGVLAFKISSGEITNLAFLSHVARKGKPVIVSTGMSTLGEVEAAVQTVRAAGNDDLALLHCVSNYPADPADANLRAMDTMAAAFGVPIGYSDHTLGIEVALAAVALGACIIEKHLTLDRMSPGPDHQASLEPDEFAQLVRGIRRIEVALGDGRKAPADSEAEVAAVARRSLVAARAIPAGTVLTEDMIAVKRPGNGLAPAMRPYLVGRTTRCFIPDGALLTLDLLG